MTLRLTVICRDKKGINYRITECIATIKTMGSFIGHIDEATFFIILSFWWMLNIFPTYVQSTRNNTHYQSRLSYGLPCRKKIPVEAICKLMFPVAGFIGELANGKGPHFINDDGNFQKLNGMQHMTIYGIFILHGILDILTFCRVKVIPPGSDYFSICLAFLWYGLSFSFHANMPGKSPLERTIHVLPTYVIYLQVVFILLHLLNRRQIAVDVGRIWCLLVLGTWFFHTSFIMYLPWDTLSKGANLWNLTFYALIMLLYRAMIPNTCGKANPAWNHNDQRNVHFLVAAFGAHCCLHLVTVPVVYAVIYLFVSRKQQPLTVSMKCQEECEILLESP